MLPWKIVQDLEKSSRSPRGPGWTRPPPESDRTPPAALATENGSWRVEDDALVLQPDSSGALPSLVRIHDDRDAFFLETPDGRLERSVPLEGG